jgi:hypothetical protein
MRHNYRDRRHVMTPMDVTECAAAVIDPSGIRRSPLARGHLVDHPTGRARASAADDSYFRAEQKRARRRTRARCDRVVTLNRSGA